MWPALTTAAVLSGLVGAGLVPGAAAMAPALAGPAVEARAALAGPAVEARAALTGPAASGPGTAVLAAPAPSASAPGPASAPQRVCRISDGRLRELSGLVATGSGYVVVNDGTEIESRKQVFFLDGRCAVRKAVPYSGDGPYDTEDLAVSADGRTLWIADTGDNITSSRHRTKVALWSMPLDGSQRPVLHRLSYPDRVPRDAEALLLADDGTPVIVTKTLGKAEVFVPGGALRTNNADPVPMKRVGEVTLPASRTENPLSAAGRVAVTGAARSPDGKRVVLRTYADAFEWDVPDGDLVRALTTGTPRATPLADPFGEAIAYSGDGSRFLTVSDAGSLGDSAEVSILSYTPTVAATPEVAEPAAKTSDARSWSDKLSLENRIYLITAVVGFCGALLVGFGIFGIVRARKRAAEDGGEPGGRRGSKPGRDEEPMLASVGPDGYDGYGDGGGRGDYPQQPGRGSRQGGVYGGPNGGGVYGGGPTGGGVYGGGPAGGGGVYGGGGRAGGPGGQGAPGGPGGPGGGVYGGGPGGGGRQGGSGGGGGVYGGGRAGGPGGPGAPGGQGGQGGPGGRGGPGGPGGGVYGGGRPAGPAGDGGGYGGPPGGRQGGHGGGGYRGGPEQPGGGYGPDQRGGGRRRPDRDQERGGYGPAQGYPGGGYQDDGGYR
ncbi:hypothetical protein AB0J86_34750 [Micromonospora sp. NPDC049559]|uniref:hypothetical protein n=1 Tax=Micromonospora sp. NPDC049559 TaxID=3155923 RepID=UPI0034423E63